MTDKLNLPDKFREIEEWLCECEAMTKAEYHDKTNSAITISKAREIFTALSDARDEIDSNNEVIRDTLDMLPTEIMETLRKHGVLDGLVEILDKAEARKE